MATGDMESLFHRSLQSHPLTSSLRLKTVDCFKVPLLVKFLAQYLVNPTLSQLENGQKIAR